MDVTMRTSKRRTAMGEEPQPNKIRSGPASLSSANQDGPGRSQARPKASFGFHPTGKTPVSSLQPETRPISQEQLINEVKGIYAGLVMVEKKCIEICKQQAQTANELSNEQWHALTALHRTLLHEHHDFFLASQHPTASSAIQRLPTKYAMPARMWRHGIHSFLELLRHSLPHSLEHMLSFINIVYQMIDLLMESVPVFHETWVECLGDLARYRIAIEGQDIRDRETWSNVARMWYNRANSSLGTGRIQHHLAVLARPNILRQWFYYSKALVGTNPFPNAQDSIVLLFNPILEGSTQIPVPGSEQRLRKHPRLDHSRAAASWALFTKDSFQNYCTYVIRISLDFDNYVRSSSNWKTQGPEVASALIAFVPDFGNGDTHLWAFRTQHEELKRPEAQPPDRTNATGVGPETKETTVVNSTREERTGAWICTPGETRSPIQTLRKASSTFRWNPSLVGFLALLTFPFSAYGMEVSARTLEGSAQLDQAPSIAESWKTFGNEAALKFARDASSYAFPGLVCTFFEVWLYLKNPAELTAAFGYASIILATITFGLSAEGINDAAVSPQSQFIYFLEGLYVIARYRCAMVKSRMPEQDYHLVDLVRIWILAFMAAGAWCASISSVSFLQVFPFSVLAVAEWANTRLPPPPALPAYHAQLPTLGTPNNRQSG